MNTIFAPITSVRNSSVIIIRISGQKTYKILRILGIKGKISHKVSNLKKIIDPDTHQLLDYALVTFFKSPFSFTGEDLAEISFHSSKFILRKIISILSSIDDCEFAKAGEFSKRAFLNEKIDLTQAEGILDLVNSETKYQHKQALNQMSGKLGTTYSNWQGKLMEILANLEAYIDFPDEDLPSDLIVDLENKAKVIMNEIDLHVTRSKNAHKIREGILIPIIGPTNAGKSSLINFLSQSDASIVSDIEGTTRDVIKVSLSINGFYVTLADTAGIRDAKSEIEKEGIKKTLHNIDQADFKILLLDVENLNFSNFFKLDKNTLLVINKIDKLSSNQKVNIKEICNINPNIKKFLEEVPKNNCIFISIKNEMNLEELQKVIQSKLQEMDLDSEEPLITNQRYKKFLLNSIENLKDFSLDKDIELACEDIRLAVRNIGNITGRVFSDDILEIIFSNFCIGK